VLQPAPAGARGRRDVGGLDVNRILIAEDEERIAAFVERGLRAAGFRPTVVPDGAAALEAAESGDHDLLILDLGLPLVDGFSVLRRLRAGGSRMPVIILTARRDTATTVSGLEGGADDYVPKPFSFDELLARVRLRLRTEGSATEATVLRYGDLALDLRSRRVATSGRTTELSAREFALLETFLRNPDHVLSREQLLSRVWGYDFDPGSNVVDVYVRYLRRKIGPGRIETIRGVGYRLTAG
jgi:DNA-binding response OmpR family regulator